jgi:hypothetical protein
MVERNSRGLPNNGAFVKQGEFCEVISSDDKYHCSHITVVECGVRK